MGYIITAEKQGFKYYFHGNKKHYPQFYWNIWNTTSISLRVYKNKKTAENMVKKLEPKMKSYNISIEEI